MISQNSKKSQAENKLHDSENMFRILFETTNNAIFIMKENFFIDCNRKTLEMFRCEHSDIIGHTLMEFSPAIQPDGTDSSKMAFAKIDAAWKGEQQIFEWQHKKFDGTLFDTEIRLNLVQLSTGPLILATVKDFTDHKIAENALSDSQNKYKTLFQKSADAILIIEGDKFVDCNDATVKMLKYDNKAELLETHPSALSPPRQPDGRDSFEKANEMMSIAIDHGSHRFEWDHKRKDGEVFPVEVLLTSVPLPEGHFIHVVWRDITARKKADLLLKESEEHHRAVVESASDAIITINKHSNVIAWNISAQVMFGYLFDEIHGKSMIKIIPECFRVLHIKSIAKLTSGKESSIIGKTVEMIGLHKDGSEFPIEFSLTSWESAGDIFFTTIIRDITKKKQDQAQLEEALEDAKQGEKIKSLFLANISHEIRTPLNSILGYSDLLQEMLNDKVSDNEREFFDIIDRSGQRLIRTVHEVLDMSQLDTDSYNLIKEEFDLSYVVQQAILELTPQMNEKDLSVEFHSSIKNPIINADEYCITQAVSNIIDNAIKYTKKGGLKIWIDENNGDLQLVIKDTGIGISKKYQKHIFDIFSQESSGYSRKYEGLGLGLALTKRYLEINNANINIDSSKGSGTKVTITFQKEDKS